MSDGGGRDDGGQMGWPVWAGVAGGGDGVHPNTPVHGGVSWWPCVGGVMHSH